MSKTLKPFLIALSLLACLLIAGANTTALAQEAQKSDGVEAAKPVAGLLAEHRPWEYYRPIVERNIFTRSSGRSSGSASSNRPTRPSRPIASSSQATWVLTGIVLQGSAPVAFFENSASHQTMQVMVGQEVGQSVVLRIEPEYVEVRLDQQSRQVALGETVDGSPVSSGTGATGSIFGSTTDSSDASSADQTQTPATSEDGVTKPGDVDSVIERMRARRLREAGQ